MRISHVSLYCFLLGIPLSVASYFSSLFDVGNHLLSPLDRLPVQKSSHLAKCPPCDQVQCAVKTKAKLKCKGGIAADFCSCCPICAKTEGEHCGGEQNILGTCDRGLFCLTEGLGEEFDRFAPQHGLCKRKPVSESAMDLLTLADQAGQEKGRDVCRPKCTPDFCLKHPRSICSATDNADQSKPCQATCQHTSCLACRFGDPEPCPRCDKDDFICIKKYGRCVKRQSCMRKKFPCSKVSKLAAGKFQCLVPECPL